MHKDTKIGEIGDTWLEELQGKILGGLDHLRPHKVSAYAIS